MQRLLKTNNYMWERRHAAVSKDPCILPNQGIFPSLKGGITQCNKESLSDSLALPWLLFTVTTRLQDFKLQSLSINSLDLDKVKLWKAHRQLALLAVRLLLTVSVTPTGPVFDASLWIFICLEERYGLVLRAFFYFCCPTLSKNQFLFGIRYKWSPSEHFLLL